MDDHQQNQHSDSTSLTTPSNNSANVSVNPPPSSAPSVLKPLPPAPKQSSRPRIERLPQSVINRIAAGEVVIRPAAALKELLENSLDAGATSISVQARDGGLRTLRVEDDGHGVCHDDLSLLCVRFATSKLREYSDLCDGSVSTFGFRGEALASVAHVARLSVVTRRGDSRVGYTAVYSDTGVLAKDITPCARGSHGTTVIVDDLFYNVPTRRVALKSSAEEYRAIVDVVARYAIRYAHVAFTCRKLTSSGTRKKSGGFRGAGGGGASGGGVGNHAVADVRTQRNATTIQNIRAAFGAVVAGQTMEFEVSIEQVDANVRAVVSTSNFSMRRGIYVFFINGRLVECNALKRAIAAAYAPFLPKSAHPFAYVDLNMRPTDIDVNVHPMKKEVRFLHEDVIIDKFVGELAARLQGSESSRTFQAQTVLVGGGKEGDVKKDVEKIGLSVGKQTVTMTDEEILRTTTPDPKTKRKDNDNDSEDSDEEDHDEDGGGEVEVDGAYDEDANRGEKAPSKKRARKTQTTLQLKPGTATKPPPTPKKTSATAEKEQRQYAKDKVRTVGDNAVGLLDRYVTGSDFSKKCRRRRRMKRRDCAPPLLTSVETLLHDMRRNSDRGMVDLLRAHTFVGVVSKEFALMQHGTQLVLADIGPLVEHLAYETALMRFADHAEIARFSPGAPVRKLVQRFLTKHFRAGDDGGTVIDAESCANLLAEKAAMLEEYFGLSFSTQDEDESEGNDDRVEADAVRLTGVPMLFDGVLPDVRGLGEMLYTLAARTDWTEEKNCFNGVARALAKWHGSFWQPVLSSSSSSGGDDGSEVIVEKNQQRVKWYGEEREWVLRHVLFESMRSEFYPPKVFTKMNVLREITSTSKLYKIFERC